MPPRWRQMARAKTWLHQVPTARRVSCLAYWEPRCPQQRADRSVALPLRLSGRAGTAEWRVAAGAGKHGLLLRTLP